MDSSSRRRPPITHEMLVTPTAAAAPSAAPHTAAASPLPGRLERLKNQPRQPGEASFFFYDTHFHSDAVKLLPGEFYVTHEDLLLLTTLGSCIAARLWDREKRVGGMNHFLLPDTGPGGAGSDSGRYGSFAMDLLIGEMIKRGATRSTKQAKVFGGAAVISGMNSSNVGERNTALVLDYLRTERITVVSKDVLNIYPRKVCFLPASGKAMVKRLASANTDALAAQECAAAICAAATCAAPPVAGGGGSFDIF